MLFFYCSSRQPKGRFLKQHLTTLLESDTATPSGVVEEEEESEGESGLEMVEGASDLEEEGVVLSEEKRHLARKVREGMEGEVSKRRKGERKDRAGKES